MTPTEIRQIIVNKRNQGEELTSEERAEALRFFSEEDIKCMRHPHFDHSKCFNKRPKQTIMNIMSRQSPPVAVEEGDDEFR